MLLDKTLNHQLSICHVFLQVCFMIVFNQVYCAVFCWGNIFLDFHHCISSWVVIINLLLFWMKFHQIFLTNDGTQCFKSGVKIEFNIKVNWTQTAPVLNVCENKQKYENNWWFNLTYRYLLKHQSHCPFYHKCYQVTWCNCILVLRLPVYIMQLLLSNLI